MKPESKRDCWTTPDWLLNYVEYLLGETFTHDLCASPGNAVARKYWTRDKPLLQLQAQDQPGRALTRNGVLWMNPPFSTPHLSQFAPQFCFLARHQAAACLTLGDISTTYYAQLEACAKRIPIVGRFSCDPPKGVKKSTPKAPMALWLFNPDYYPVPARRWQDLARDYAGKRKRY